MASQAGIFYFDGRPVACGGWSHVERGLAMAQGIEEVWSGPEAQECVPRRSAAGLAMTWDGRLDNRSDLLLRLGRAVPADAGDACVALAVFERWGVEGLRSLVGDWSMAIWDHGNRTLHLARDYMGARPLYYCVDPEYVAWSDRLGDLVRRCGRDDALSEAFVAGFMSLRKSPEATPYEHVHAVPTATCLSFGPGGDQRRRRFWQLESAEIRYADRRNYEEQLRQLWRDAVASRLRTAATVWAELSGGLDSSSVVCMADRLIAGGHVPARALRLLSHATLRSPEGDERRFIAEVERQVGVASEIVGVEDHQDGVDEELAWVTPDSLHGVGLECVRRVRRAGGRLVLSGRFGDVVMGCQPDNSIAVVEDLARLRLLTAIRNLRAWSRASRKPFVEIAWRLFRPLPHARPDRATGLLTPRLLEKVQPDITHRSLRNLRASKRPLGAMVLGYSGGARLDVPSLPPGVTYAYPFTDRRVVEFMLAIPGEELSAPGDTRSLMRRAFADLLPARVRARTSKGYYPPSACRAARRLAASMPPASGLEVVRRGWIDPSRFEAAVRSLRDGGGETCGDIHCVLRLEAWLRAREERASIPRRKEVNTHAVLNA